MRLEPEKFRVIYTGKFNEGWTIEQVQQNLVEKCNIKTSVFRNFLLGRPILLKKNLIQSQALAHQMAFDSLGLSCEVQSMPIFNDSDKHGLIDRRKQERRSEHERRKEHRGNALRPDRRTQERRQMQSA